MPSAGIAAFTATAVACSRRGRPQGSSRWSARWRRPALPWVGSRRWARWRRPAMPSAGIAKVAAQRAAATLAARRRGGRRQLRFWRRVRLSRRSRVFRTRHRGLAGALMREQRGESHAAATSPLPVSAQCWSGRRLHVAAARPPVRLSRGRCWQQGLGCHPKAGPPSAGEGCRAVGLHAFLPRSVSVGSVAGGGGGRAGGVRPCGSVVWGVICVPEAGGVESIFIPIARLFPSL